MTKSSLTPSATSATDPDWSHSRETVRILNLLAAHIEVSMQDGDDSVAALTDSFTSMMGHMKAIEECIGEMPATQHKTILQQHTLEVSSKVQNAIIAFQFYDKLTQRLSHASHSLTSLSGLVSHPDNLFSPFEWQELHKKIKSSYTIDADRKMFDLMLSDLDVEEALESTREAGNDDNIELF
ncbi:MAG: hypothetical protein BMS9Abin26_2130 [Gammaproteobacteria bacterium]|nr:MAG: hypothetical protein BMS9Abin26_2130 [Gammaproteobacteria bacterium]